MTEKHADAFDMEAEQNVLSFMLNNPTWIGSLGITEWDFHEVYHRQIATDLIAGRRPRKPPHAYNMNDLGYVDELRNAPPNLDEVRLLVRHLKHLAIERGKAVKPPALRLVD